MLLMYVIVEGCGGMVISVGLVLHIQELYDSYRSPSVFRVVKFSGTWCDGCVVGIDITSGGAV
jgi:hypothetical protein